MSLVTWWRKRAEIRRLRRSVEAQLASGLGRKHLILVDPDDAPKMPDVSPAPRHRS